MRKILGLTIAFMLLIGMGGIGTWAYFQDTETSTGNVLAAGTLELKTDDVDGVTQTLYASNLKPGDIVSGSITLRNAGSVAGSIVDLVFTYVENDDIVEDLPNMTADETAAMIKVTALSLGGSNLLGGVSDGNSNLYIDMQDLKNANLSDPTGIGAPGTKVFSITVQVWADTSSDFQSDGITIEMTFTLNQ